MFPHLSALEAVTLAVCERRGYAGTWWQKLPAYPDAVEEAYAILLSLRLGASCYRPTRELAYGQQRLLEIALALATNPKVLLLDEPAAGVPQGESAELFSVIADLSQDIAVLFIEHDMNVVFRFARRIIVMVGGRILVEGTPDGDRRRCACARGLSRRSASWLRRCLRSRACAPVTATPSCSTASHSRSANGGSLALLGRNGVGKTTLLLTIMGFTRVSRGTIAWRGRDITRLAPHGRARDGIGWVAQEREIFPSLNVEENLTVAARPGRWSLEPVYNLFPRLKERRASAGNHLSGGEQQMLAIARALMTNPALLLLDEPLEGLAPIIVEELTAAIRRMTSDEGTAFILVEQHAEVALSLTEHADGAGARQHRASRALARPAAGSGNA